MAVAGGAAGVAIYNHNKNTWQDAYTEIIKEYRQEIENYSWQTSQVRENEPTLVGESRAITVADIMGDDTPELIFAAQDESDPNKADLHIYTYIEMKQYRSIVENLIQGQMRIGTNGDQKEHHMY